MIKRPSHKEDRIIDVYAHNKSYKIPEANSDQIKVRKRHVYNHSWGFYQPPSETNRTTGRIITKEIEDLTNTISHFDLIDIHRMIYSTTAEYTFFLMHMVCSAKYTYSRP